MRVPEGYPWKALLSQERLRLITVTYRFWRDLHSLKSITLAREIKTLLILLPKFECFFPWKALLSQERLRPWCFRSVHHRNRHAWKALLSQERLRRSCLRFSGLSLAKPWKALLSQERLRRQVLLVSIDTFIHPWKALLSQERLQPTAAKWSVRSCRNASIPSRRSPYPFVRLEKQNSNACHAGHRSGIANFI